ncbi:MAG: efflux RND transporter periplasmic adaptor subunit [Gammaproteobacteria bacterium]|nr:efflux RND transporter periplasmic adaptor subunit [Gammaproteobacteria bacterium]
MADPSARIDQLKIDRSMPAPDTRNWIWLIAAGAAVLAALLWFVLGRGASAVLVETDIARKPPSAAVASSVLDASGYVVARRQATVSSKVTGKVLEVLVEEGMSVEKDQIVAMLDDTTQQAQLAVAIAQAESSRATLAEFGAQLRNARQELERVRDLAAKGLASRASLDAAEALHDELAARLETGRENVGVAESNVMLARDALSNMTIRAPFAGMVVTKNAQPGEMISPISAGGGFTRTGICTIIDNDSLEIEVDVNEAYIQRVAAGQRVSALLDAYPDWRIPAEVIAIIPTADRQKATVRVRIGFLERDQRILRDMGVKVSFLGSEMPQQTTTEVQGVMVAGAALRSDADGDFVWLVRDGVAERRSVELGGPSDRPQVLIRTGLVAGDSVVRTAESPLSSGQAVKTN